MEEEILKLLNDNVTCVKLGCNGDYIVENALLQDDFNHIVTKILEIFKSKSNG